jgi:Flp pilus assembly pilin Flp
MRATIDDNRGNRDRERGQTLVEYALILAFVSLAAVTILALIAVVDGGYFSGVVTTFRNLHP